MALHACDSSTPASPTGGQEGTAKKASAALTSEAVGQAEPTRGRDPAGIHEDADQAMNIGPSCFVAFSNRGDLVASCSQRRVHVRAVERSKPLQGVPLSNPSDGVFSHDNRLALGVVM